MREGGREGHRQCARLAFLKSLKHLSALPTAKLVLQHPALPCQQSPCVLGGHSSILGAPARGMCMFLADPDSSQVHSLVISPQSCRCWEMIYLSSALLRCHHQGLT